VEDNGVGFDLERTLQAQETMGLQQLYALVAWQNGELHISSSPGVGTAVYALLPQQELDPIVAQSLSRSFLRRLANRSQRPSETPKVVGTIKIMLATEQPLQRQGWHRLLSANSQFQIVGEIQELSQSVEQLQQLQPQLLIINPVCERFSEREILRMITQACPDTAVLVISHATQDAYVIAALESGAHGYIPNTATITDMNTAIMRVSQKEHYLSPDLSLDLSRWQDTQAFR
jgi:AmiR/NasT family two-component response regulator